MAVPFSTAQFSILTDDGLATDVVDAHCERGRLIARRSDVFGLASVRRVCHASLSRDSASLNLTRCLTLTNPHLNPSRDPNQAFQPAANCRPDSPTDIRTLRHNPSTSLAPPHSPHPPRSAGCRRGIKLSTSSHSSPGAARRGDPVSLLTTYPPTRASAQSSASVRRFSSTCKPQEGRLPI